MSMIDVVGDVDADLSVSMMLVQVDVVVMHRRGSC
jgi:hypothetical protein